MTDTEPVSILTASAKTHYVAILIFAVLFGLFYVFHYTNYFKSIKDVLQKWGLPFMSDTNEDTTLDNDMDHTNSNDEMDELNKTTMEDILSPF